jgi:hypothetical protein
LCGARKCELVHTLVECRDPRRLGTAKSQNMNRSCATRATGFIIHSPGESLQLHRRIKAVIRICGASFDCVFRDEVRPDIG